MKDYVRKAIGGKKLVRDKIGALVILARKNEIEFTESDANWLIKGLKKENFEANNLANQINQKEAERQRLESLAWMEKNRPLDILDKAIKKIQADIKEWAGKMVEDPLHELSWSRGAFESAAKLKVYKEFQYYLIGNENAERWAEILEDNRERAISMASSPASSTSPTSNYAETMEMKARADIVRSSHGDHTTVEISYWFWRYAELTNSVPDIHHPAIKED
jgi:hypothetical protein